MSPYSCREILSRTLDFDPPLRKASARTLVVGLRDRNARRELWESHSAWLAGRWLDLTSPNVPEQEACGYRQNSDAARHVCHAMR
jgi:hypothetical protein